MPAPAVIPTPIAYINAAAVKKLVVGSRVGQCKVALFVRLGSDHGGGSGLTPCAKLSALTGRNGPVSRSFTGSKAPTHQPYAYGTSANVTVNKPACPKQAFA